jgi:hypothetical protein
VGATSTETEIAPILPEASVTKKKTVKKQAVTKEKK